LAQDASLAHEVLLTDELGERAGPHTLREGCAGDRRGLGVVVTKQTS
jgi:hypothetical protein